MSWEEDHPRRHHVTLSEDDIAVLKTFPIEYVSKQAGYSVYRLRLALNGHELRRKTYERLMDFIYEEIQKLEEGGT